MVTKRTAPRPISALIATRRQSRQTGSACQSGRRAAAARRANSKGDARLVTLDYGHPALHRIEFRKKARRSPSRTRTRRPCLRPISRSREKDWYLRRRLRRKHRHKRSQRRSRFVIASAAGWKRENKVKVGTRLGTINLLRQSPQETNRNNRLISS